MLYYYILKSLSEFCNMQRLIDICSVQSHRCRAQQRRSLLCWNWPNSSVCPETVTWPLSLTTERWRTGECQLSSSSSSSSSSHARVSAPQADHRVRDTHRSSLWAGVLHGQNQPRWLHHHPAEGGHGSPELRSGQRQHLRQRAAHHQRRTVAQGQSVWPLTPLTPWPVSQLIWIQYWETL